jgi:hypothetical protein
MCSRPAPAVEQAIPSSACDHWSFDSTIHLHLSCPPTPLLLRDSLSWLRVQAVILPDRAACRTQALRPAAARLPVAVRQPPTAGDADLLDSRAIPAPTSVPIVRLRSLGGSKVTLRPSGGVDHEHVPTTPGCLFAGIVVLPHSGGLSPTEDGQSAGGLQQAREVHQLDFQGSPFQQ